MLLLLADCCACDAQGGGEQRVGGLSPARAHTMENTRVLKEGRGTRHDDDDGAATAERSGSGAGRRAWGGFCGPLTAGLLGRLLCCVPPPPPAVVPPGTEVGCTVKGEKHTAR
eukprot:COSAG01_NODE_18759_length_1055_cov_1.404812_2_plen_112_part_01